MTGVLRAVMNVLKFRVSEVTNDFSRSDFDLPL